MIIQKDNTVQFTDQAAWADQVDRHFLPIPAFIAARGADSESAHHIPMEIMAKIDILKHLTTV
jgi:hypothetical protein